jgi:hypothetical protein
MRESLDVDEVLRTAVQQMRRALGLARVEVRLQPAEQPADLATDLRSPLPPSPNERP